MVVTLVLSINKLPGELFATLMTTRYVRRGSAFDLTKSLMTGKLSGV